MPVKCELGEVSRAAYYKWLNHKPSSTGTINKEIAEKIEKIHAEDSTKGYRRIRDDLERYHDIDVNGKRVLRICRKLDIKSTIKYKKMAVHARHQILSILQRIY